MTKKGLATKQRKFATQIASQQNSVNYHHRAQIDIFIPKTDHEKKGKITHSV